MLLLSLNKEGVELCTYSSNNILKSEYQDENLKIFFLNGTCYSYEGVSDKEYMEFKLAESQGKELNKKIKTKPFKKLDNFLITEHVKELESLKFKSFEILLKELNEIDLNDYQDHSYLIKKINNNIQILGDIKNIL